MLDYLCRLPGLFNLPCAFSGCKTTTFQPFNFLIIFFTTKTVLEKFSSVCEWILWIYDTFVILKLTVMLCFPLWQKSPLKTVKGLVWGSYVGSPDQGEPTMIWIQNHPSAISLLVALPTGGMFGLGANSCLLVMYSKEKGIYLLVFC